MIETKIYKNHRISLCIPEVNKNNPIRIMITGPLVNVSEPLDSDKWAFATAEWDIDKAYRDAENVMDKAS